MKISKNSQYIKVLTLKSYLAKQINEYLNILMVQLRNEPSILIQYINFILFCLINGHQIHFQIVLI